MPWSGTPPNQSYSRSDGTRTGTTVWQEAEAASVDIISTDHDTHDQDLAAGINAAVKKDGGNTPTANLPMGGYKHTNVADGAALTQYATIKQLINSGVFYAPTVGGTGDAVTLTTGMSVTAYTAGQCFAFIVASTNSGAMTIAVDGLAAKSVKRLNGANPVAASMLATSIAVVRYDGTNFQWINEFNAYETGDGIITVQDRLSSPPGSPTNGYFYMIFGTPTGAWSTFAENDIVKYSSTGTAWTALTPQEGWIAWVIDEELNYQWDGAAWNAWDNVTAPPTSYAGHINVTYSVANGTAGGAASASWSTRPINTTAKAGTGTLSGVTLSSNTLTAVPAGTYMWMLSAAFYGVTHTQARLKATTAGVLGYTVNQAVDPANAGNELNANGSGVFTLAADDTIWVEDIVSASTGTNDRGVASSFSGQNETYLSLTLIDLKALQGPRGVQGPQGTRAGLTTNGDSSLVITSSTQTLVLTAALTASRTWTLPAAADIAEGDWIDFVDQAGGVSSTYYLKFVRAGSDTLNGSTEINVTSPRSWVRFFSNGVDKWTAFNCASTEQMQYFPVVQPSSGNIQAQGTPTTHQLLWSDANQALTCDAIYWNCTDPSALAYITVGGTATNGDVMTLTFTVSGTPYTAAHTVTTGQTTTQIATALTNAIKANSNLYGAVDAVNRISGGGSDKPIPYVTSVGATIYFDHDSRLTISVQKSITGAATETLTIDAANTFGATLSKAWDSNPLNLVSRVVTGVAPPANSNIYNLVVAGGTSASPSTAVQQYANGGVEVISSTAGLISSRWVWYTPDAAGTINQGMCLGAGLYGVGTAGGDKGANSANFDAFYVSGRNVLSRDIAVVRKTADQSVTTLSSWVKLTFNTETIASANYDSTTNSRYTAQYAGYYDFELTADVTVGGTAATMAFSFHVNGAISGPQLNVSRGININESYTLRHVVYLAANDYVEAFIYTTQNVTVEGGTNNTHMIVREQHS